MATTTLGLRSEAMLNASCGEAVGEEHEVDSLLFQRL